MTPEPAKEEVPTTAENHSMESADTPSRKSLSPKIVYGLMALIVIAGIAFASWSNDKITSQEATIVKLAGIVDQQNQSIDSLNDWGNSTAELINSQEADVLARLACLELGKTGTSSQTRGSMYDFGCRTGFMRAISEGTSEADAEKAILHEQVISLCPRLMDNKFKNWIESADNMSHEKGLPLCYQ
jgi:hypothetical protein